MRVLLIGASVRVCAYVCSVGANAGSDAAAAAVEALDLTSDSSSVASKAEPAAAALPIQQSQAAPVVSMSQQTFPAYDGFAAHQYQQAAAARSAAARRFSAVPAALLAKPLPPGVDSEAIYGKCPVADCQLQRIAKVTSAGKGANGGRIFLTCRLSSQGNAHNRAFGWRDEWLEKNKHALKPADIAWRQRQASIEAQLAAGQLPTEIYGSLSHSAAQ